MREFEHPNLEGFVCPLCDTSTDAPVVLIPIPGTEEGNIMQAAQVHSHCIEQSLGIWIMSRRPEGSHHDADA